MPVEAAVRGQPDADDRAIAIDDLAAEMASLNVRHRWPSLPVVLSGGYTWASIYYLLTGAHAAHLAVGLIMIACFLTIRLDSQRRVGLSNVANYWHFVDGVWLIMFFLIYVI
ncbi:Cytochrome c oxidase subunit 3 [Pirellulimonas nuda]|uniref:Cytochrome c oxidase subunit 3 n=2 Tax=Pirellulimonas nuda TaxID=2528009 RepID=A0A518DDL8_9BACT|nr:Cytochrome c oxidase subunit 3 [Pirellulimonas nuda]